MVTRDRAARVAQQDSTAAEADRDRLLADSDTGAADREAAVLASQCCRSRSHRH